MQQQFQASLALAAVDVTNKLIASQISGTPERFAMNSENTHAPWNYDLKHFHKIDNPEAIDSTLRTLQDENVLFTLVSNEGMVHGDSVLVQFDQKTLSIDKPSGFKINIFGTVRLFFQDMMKEWGFFELEVVGVSTYTLALKYPKSLYRQQCRKSLRVSAPAYTTVFFYRNNHIHYGGLVKNMSNSGMLLCSDSKDNDIPDGSTIQNISIVLSNDLVSENDNRDISRSNVHTISEGKIVRSFLDQTSKRICYGISFEDKIETHNEMESLIREVT